MSRSNKDAEDIEFYQDYIRESGKTIMSLEVKVWELESKLKNSVPKAGLEKVLAEFSDEHAVSNSLPYPYKLGVLRAIRKVREFMNDPV